MLSDNRSTASPCCTWSTFASRRLVDFALVRNARWLDNMSTTAISPETMPETPSLSTLPSELVVEISEHLTASSSFGSLASFNITCKWIREATLPILYRKVILFRQNGAAAGEGHLRWGRDMSCIPEGCKYTRQVQSPVHSINAHQCSARFLFVRRPSNLIEVSTITPSVLVSYDPPLKGRKDTLMIDAPLPRRYSQP
jgi:hypothetical protein